MSKQSRRLLSGTSRETLNSRRWLILLAVLILCTAPFEVAVAQQTGAATLVGTITDSTGARMPQAQVTVINVDMAFRTEVKANAEVGFSGPPPPFQRGPENTTDRIFLS